MITPVYPIDNERLVLKTSSILIETDTNFVSVSVDGVIVYTGSFAIGWTGVLVNKVEGGKRLTLTPAAGLFGTTIVIAQDTLVSLTYSFVAGSDQITTTNNTLAPKLAGSNHVAYATSDGEVFMRVNALESKLVTGSNVDIAINAGEIVVAFLDNGTVFTSKGLSTDSPTLLSQPNSLVNEVEYTVSTGREASLTTADFIPVKNGEQDTVSYTISSGELTVAAADNTKINPTQIANPPTAALRIPLPIVGSEHRKAMVEFRVLKFRGTSVTTIAVLDVTQYRNNQDPFIDHLDTNGQVGDRYAIDALYGNIITPHGIPTLPPDFADILLYAVSSGAKNVYNTVNFTVSKLPLLDFPTISPLSSGISFSYTSTGFNLVGVGSA